MKKLESISRIPEGRLTDWQVDFLRQAGQTASQMNQKVYLVGGVVRDLLLNRTNSDLDLVVEGDAISLARNLAKKMGARVVAHSRFNTAKIHWERGSADFASARKESYRRPGQLPTIEGKADIFEDLVRRDFTINALAVQLTPDGFGPLIDVLSGRKDLDAGLIRILHDKSFQDDATRIWRAIRYEQRLCFRIEGGTEALIRRDLVFLDGISSDRLRNELELCLEEDKPEKIFQRTSELGILQQLSPAWLFSPQIARSMRRARTLTQPYAPPLELYLAILFSGLGQAQLEALVDRFNFGRSAVTTLQDSLTLKKVSEGLADPSLSRGKIYALLKNFDSQALLANRIILDSGVVRERIDLYLNQLRQVKTALRGIDLINAGYPAGPAIGEMLEKIKEAKLDGKVTSSEDELAFLKQISRSAD